MATRARLATARRFGLTAVDPERDAVDFPVLGAIFVLMGATSVMSVADFVIP